MTNVRSHVFAIGQIEPDDIPFSNSWLPRLHDRPAQNSWLPEKTYRLFKINGTFVSRWTLSECHKP
jgi:hypothetical protein